MRLDFDRWNGNRNVGESVAIDHPSLELVLKRLNALDQKEYTQLALEGKMGNLLIGGGLGHYVCTYTQGDHKTYFNLLDPLADSAHEIDLVTGGQAGSFPARLIVGYAEVATAIAHYLMHESMHPDLAWEEDK